jgi:hypothetical protein
MPQLRQMMSFLDNRFNETVGLYLAPGSLQIDVFIRENYTADSNAASILLLELFADAELFVGNISGLFLSLLWLCRLIMISGLFVHVAWLCISFTILGSFVHVVWLCI